MLYCTILYYTVLYYNVPYYTILYYTIAGGLWRAYLMTVCTLLEGAS